MKLLLFVPLALALVVPSASAINPGPVCGTISIQNTFFGIVDSNCIQVSGYVCIEPRYFGGGGGGPLGNFVCEEAITFSLP